LTPAQIAFGRMLGGALLVALWARASGQPLAIRSVRLLAYGLVAAVHFLTYIAALQLTSIAHVLVLVNLSPVFVAVLSRSVLGETLPRSRYLGITLALAGVAVMVGFEPVLSPRRLYGDLLALLSGLAYAAYSLAGRRERQRHSLYTYAASVYFAAALALAPAALPSLPGPRELAASVWPLFLLALLPTAIGHTLYNAALRRVPAVTANLVATQEVTLGVLFGMVLLAEMPPLTAVVGGLLSLAGVALVLRRGQ
jgi:drug/metabolite transporter (DMT)-like permease